MKKTSVKAEWTEEQSEIWEYVQNYTEQILCGNWKNAIKFFHNNYYGWNGKNLMPTTKVGIVNELQKTNKIKIIAYNLIPLTISVFPNIAIVNYFFSLEYKNSKGENKTKRTRNMDVLLYQQNNWILIGDYAEQNK